MRLGTDIAFLMCCAICAAAQAMADETGRAGESRARSPAGGSPEDAGAAAIHHRDRRRDAHGVLGRDVRSTAGRTWGGSSR